MAGQNPPVYNVSYILDLQLEDMANPGSFKANPTIAAGDIKVSVDDGTYDNADNLPAVNPSSSINVKVILSTAEMSGARIKVSAIDQTVPKEWADTHVTIYPTEVP